MRRVRKKKLTNLTGRESVSLKKLTLHDGVLRSLLWNLDDYREYDRVDCVWNGDIRKYEVFILRDDGCIYGWATLYGSKIMLYVNRKYRKRGAGELLFKNVYREMRRKGGKRISVFPHDKRSHNFFDKMRTKGFKIKKDLAF